MDESPESLEGRLYELFSDCQQGRCSDDVLTDRVRKLVAELREAFTQQAVQQSLAVQQKCTLMAAEVAASAVDECEGALLQRLRDQQEVAEATQSRLTSEVLKIRREHNAAKVALRSAEQRLKKAQEEVDALTSRVQELEAACAHGQAENGHLVADLEALRGRLRGYVASMGSPTG